MIRGTLLAFCLLGQAKDDPVRLLEAYARLDLDAKARAQRSEVVFDDASKDRVLLAQRLVACGKDAVRPLVQGLRSGNRHVRALSAELLGVLGDPAAGPALIQAARDGDPTVRIYSIQSLAWLKSAPDVIRAAEKDPNANVRFVAQRAQEQFRAELSFRDAYAPLRREDLASAVVGKPAPDFTLPAADGRPWRLSERKGRVLLMFQLADW